MSNGVLQPVSDANERSEQSLQPYQSVWLTHWTRTRSEAAGETSSSYASGKKGLDDVSRNDCLTRELNGSSRSVRGFGINKIRNFEVGGSIIEICPKGVGDERMLCLLPKDGRDTDGMQALRHELARNLECGNAVDCKSGIQFPSLIIPRIQAADGIPSQWRHSVGEGTSSNLPKWTRTHPIRKGSILGSNPLEETFVESSSLTLPYRFDSEKYECDKGKALVPVNSEQPRSANVRMLEHEQCHEHRYSTDLVCERKVDCPSQSDNPLDECFKQVIPCDHCLSAFGRCWYPRMRKYSGVRLFSNQSNPSEESKTKKSHDDCYSVLKLQNIDHDVETMRICTTVDALEGMPDSCPRFSQRTNGLLIIEKNDVNRFKENDMFKSRVIPKINGNISSELHCLSPFFEESMQQVKLQPISSLIDSEVNANIRDTKASKLIIENDSSAEIDTKDVHSFKEKNSKNLHSGSSFTASTKAFNMESDTPYRCHVVSSREVGHGSLNNKLPDINLEFPHASPGAASLSDSMHPSSLKTHSLDMDKLLKHVDWPQTKSNFSLDGFQSADPGSRWVKRLKLSSSNFSAQGTKSSNFSSGSSDEKMSKLFSKILGSSTTSSAPTPRKQHVKKSVLSDKSGDVSKEDDNHLMQNPKDKDKALLLSHAWIGRWLHNGRRATVKKPETKVVREPQRSKLTLEKLQKEQFPSIAAMALMGKALTCFQPCELQKRGSFTVWNTRTF